MRASVSARVKRCLRAAPGSIPPPSPAPDFQRHRRKCAICNHPDREAIEELFIYWHSAASIEELYQLPDWSVVYRHARAAGLYELRRHNIRAVLDHLLEGVDSVEATPLSIVAAVRAYTCLTDSGAWVEPARRVLYFTTHSSNASSEVTSSASPLDDAGSPPRTPEAKASPAPQAAGIVPRKSREATASPISNPKPPTSASSNRQSPELETPVSHSKQTTAPLSNRQISPHPDLQLPLPNSSPGAALK